MDKNIAGMDIVPPTVADGGEHWLTQVSLEQR